MKAKKYFGIGILAISLTLPGVSQGFNLPSRLGIAPSPTNPDPVLPKPPLGDDPILHAPDSSDRDLPYQYEQDQRELNRIFRGSNRQQEWNQMHNEIEDLGQQMRNNRGY